MVAGLSAFIAALLVTLAETIHLRRCRRIGRLAFGPSGSPAAWTRLAPASRVTAVSGLVWGLVTLLLIPPQAHVSETLPDNERRHIMIVLDVSPSMRLKDAGPDRDQTRMKRASVVMGSFFQRVPSDQHLLSVVAFYNGAKPVVVATKDFEVIRNILDDLPMQYAFRSGKTDLFSGLQEAAKLMRPWQPRSTLLILLSDGDTVPSSGMPRMPASVRDVLIVGLGDPRTGSFIDGRQSRQDASTLRQVAARLGGTYHDGNAKHLGSTLLAELTLRPRKSPFERLTRREYALLACGLGASILAFLPLLLHHAGTRWRPGVPAPGDRPMSFRYRDRVDSMIGGLASLSISRNPVKRGL